MDTSEFAEFLATEADRVVAAAPGTKRASETYRLMMDLRSTLFRGEEVAFWSLCAVPTPRDQSALGLLLVTNRAVYLNCAVDSGRSIEHVALAAFPGLEMRWRAAPHADGSRTAVIPGLPEIRFPPEVADELDEVWTSHQSR